MWVPAWWGGGKGGGQCAKRGGKIAAQQLARNKQRDFQCDGVITPASDRRGKFSGQGVRLAGRRCACVEACRASASAVIEKAAQRNTVRRWQRSRSISSSIRTTSILPNIRYPTIGRRERSVPHSKTCARIAWCVRGKQMKQMRSMPRYQRCKY